MNPFTVAPKAESTHKATNELGEAIVGHDVRWVSASLVTQGDHASEGGCLKRLWLERVGGKPREETDAMRAGTAMHTENEMYLRTGNRNALGPIGLAGIHYMPTPGPDLLLEHPIIVGGNGIIQGVYLFAAGVPFAGHVDCIDHRGMYPDQDGEWHRDPPNTVNVWDWKSTSDLKWAKSAAQVAATIQMNSYGMAAFRMWPHLEHARLTHVYFQRNGKRAAQLATSRPPREAIEKKWKYVEGVVRTIVDVAREETPDRVPANTKACHSYNKDCPHLAYCPEGKRAREFNSLDECFGPRLAERLQARATNQPVVPILADADFLANLTSQLPTQSSESSGGGHMATNSEIHGVGFEDGLQHVQASILRSQQGSYSSAGGRDTVTVEESLATMLPEGHQYRDVSRNVGATGCAVSDLSLPVREKRGRGDRPLSHDRSVPIASLSSVQRDSWECSRAAARSNEHDQLSATVQNGAIKMGFLDEVSTPVTPPAGVGVAFSLDDLVAEETAARTAQDAVVEIPVPSPEFTAALALIGASGLGMPPLGGEAAAWSAACGGQAVAPGASFPGMLKLAKLPEMTQPAQILGLAEEIKRKGLAKATTPTAPAPVAPTPIAPPDAPASNPAIAALPVEGLDNAKAKELAAATTEIPGLAETVATIPSAAAPTTPDPMLAAPIEPPKKRGRPPGTPRKEKTVTTTETAGQVSVTKSEHTIEENQPDTSISMFADVVGLEGDVQSLAKYLADLQEFLLGSYSDVAKSGDIRFASGALDYGKWRGAVAGLVRKTPPPPGTYLIDTRGNEIAELVFVSLREVCLASGGQHIRGAR